ncbi:hypothetical protein LJR235_000180 [Pararhizobium sp. LjRoot235]|uniref:hypothetical protein n=1 Tax=Pararhizobium sp. LjRoot235 TaxID=3342291 RepID=UPI003ECE19F0
MRQVDDEYSEASFKAGLRELFAASGNTRDLLNAFTDLLAAAFDRAALAMEAGGNREGYERAIAALIDGISVK